MSRPSSVATSPSGDGCAELAGRVAIVSGAGRGIGRAVACRLADAGATVVFGYRTAETAATAAVSAVRSGGGAADAVHLDVADPGQATSAVEAVADRYGSVDILVNNAGILPRSGFLDLTLQEWEAVLRTNLTGSFVLGQAAGRVMAAQRAGSIVNVSSTNEDVASERCTAYAASKGGLRMLTRQMALELGPLGVRTNAVAPGMVETDLNEIQRRDPHFRAAALDRIPIARFTTVDEVAETVCFLVSDRASAINGATLFVDGGRHAA